MAETPARYCSNCGHELSPEDQFCPNCGNPVHETATVPTPEADVPVPPPPPQAAAAAAPPPQAEGTQRSWPRRHPYLTGCLGLVGVLALLIIALIAIVALAGGGNGGDEPATKDDPPAKAPSDTPESTPESTPTGAPADDTSTIIMRDVKMAADENGDQPTTVFSPNDTFYCVGYLEDAPDDTKVTAVWLAADVENIEPNSKIKQISATGGSGLFRFNLSPADTWPTGEYAVQIYLNDEAEPTKALPFEVR
jgi:hypothetical protein